MDTEPDRDPRLTDAIGRLHDSSPGADLWPGIARQLKPRRSAGTLLVRWPTALAAGLVIAIATSGGTVLWLRHVTPAPTVATAAGPTAVTRASAVPASFTPGDSALAHAVDDLERAVRGNLGQLDANARASVTSSLAALDDAIAQATVRQNASPDDPRIATYLTSTLRKKLQVLRAVSSVTRSRS